MIDSTTLTDNTGTTGLDTDYYVTFGNRDFSRQGGWVRLTKCSSLKQAMKFANKKFGGQFEVVRDQFEFKPKRYPEGELGVYEVNQ